MIFPSPSVAEWHRHLEKLYASDTGPYYLFRLEGEFLEPCKTLVLDQARSFVCGIFWSVWVDQVLHHVLDEGKGAIPKDAALYAEYSDLYPTPKIIPRVGVGMASPWRILEQSLGVFSPDADQLRDGRRDFWTEEVARWLVEAKGRSEVVQSAERAFREDLANPSRFPKEAQPLLTTVP